MLAGKIRGARKLQHTHTLQQTLFAAELLDSALERSVSIPTVRSVIAFHTVVPRVKTETKTERTHPHSDWRRGGTELSLRRTRALLLCGECYLYCAAFDMWGGGVCLLRAKVKIVPQLVTILHAAMCALPRKRSP